MIRFDVEETRGKIKDIVTYSAGGPAGCITVVTREEYREVDRNVKSGVITPCLSPRFRGRSREFFNPVKHAEVLNNPSPNVDGTSRRTFVSVSTSTSDLSEPHSFQSVSSQGTPASLTHFGKETKDKSEGKNQSTQTESNPSEDKKDNSSSGNKDDRDKDKKPKESYRKKGKKSKFEERKKQRDRDSNTRCSQVREGFGITGSDTDSNGDEQAAFLKGGRYAGASMLLNVAAPGQSTSNNKNHTHSSSKPSNKSSADAVDDYLTIKEETIGSPFERIAENLSAVERSSFKNNSSERVNCNISYDFHFSDWISAQGSQEGKDGTNLSSGELAVDSETIFHKNIGYSSISETYMDHFRNKAQYDQLSPSKSNFLPRFKTSAHEKLKTESGSKLKENLSRIGTRIASGHHRATDNKLDNSSFLEDLNKGVELCFARKEKSLKMHVKENTEKNENKKMETSVEVIRSLASRDDDVSSKPSHKKSIRNSRKAQKMIECEGKMKTSLNKNASNQRLGRGRGRVSAKHRGPSELNIDMNSKLNGIFKTGKRKKTVSSARPKKHLRTESKPTSPQFQENGEKILRKNKRRAVCEIAQTHPPVAVQGGSASGRKTRIMKTGQIQKAMEPLTRVDQAPSSLSENPNPQKSILREDFNSVEKHSDEFKGGISLKCVEPPSQQFDENDQLSAAKRRKLALAETTELSYPFSVAEDENNKKFSTLNKNISNQELADKTEEHFEDYPVEKMPQFLEIKPSTLENYFQSSSRVFQRVFKSVMSIFEQKRNMTQSEDASVQLPLESNLSVNESVSGDGERITQAPKECLAAENNSAPANLSHLHSEFLAQNAENCYETPKKIRNSASEPEQIFSFLSHIANVE